jgi:subtilase family serine protease
MKQHAFLLAAAIAAALAGAPGLLQAQSATPAAAVAALGTHEAPRVTQTVMDSQRMTLAQTHLNVTAQATSGTPLTETTAMNHLQLILKRSPIRSAQIEARIANQHNPQSPLFHQWLTPQQFGDAYGVVDSDIAAVTSWLTAEGFTVSGVYPNKMQIDFSGTASQVNRAFKTQETVYNLANGDRYLSHVGDVSVPAALLPVIAGVVGLSEAPSAKPLPRSTRSPTVLT